jgi:hypothetical protein
MAIKKDKNGDLQLPKLSTVRHATALQLFIDGKNYAQIARDVGYKDSSAAKKAVTAALEKGIDPDPGHQLKAMLGRLEIYAFKYHPDAKAGDIQALKVMLMIMDRQAKLLGLYADNKDKDDVKKNEIITAKQMDEIRRKVYGLTTS